MTTPVEPVQRVYHLPKSLKLAMRDARLARVQTQQQLVTTAIAENLPTLVESLTKMGFAPSGKKSPAKLPLHPETLLALQEASKATTLPATSLLFLCLSSATGYSPATSPAPTPKAKERKGKAPEKATRKPSTKKGAK